MSNDRWMLYGATGETGQKIIDEALRRGHRPVLAGRSATKVRPLAEQHGLDWIAASVDDAAALRAAVGTVGLLLNAAGPFAATSPALMASSLQAGANYLDIANE